MNKRIAALLLCLVTVFTILPLSSAAENADSSAIPEGADMASDKIGIGINLFYHCEHYYKYTDPPGNNTYTTTFSYHKYPNEPATLSHVAVRASNASGSWVVNGDYEARLAGTVQDVVRDDFFTSPDTVTTVNDYATTIGIADPTGEKVKAMLKLTEEDYQAIVVEWIEWAKISGFNTPGGYTDKYGNNATCKDPQWDTADPADYKAVPYVVKFQGNHVWFIDIIILPRAKYTLGYDRNLDEGFILPYDKAFPETTTHDEGQIASIVGNPNVTPTNSAGDTATFLYWVDKDGNKYGNGYTMSIPMWEDKVLYAIWNYSNNPQYGNIRVTKEVTNLNSDVVDDSNPGFTMTVTLSNENVEDIETIEYAYTIYDSASNVQLSGTIKSGSSFALKDKWSIIIRDLPKDTRVTITESLKDHYLARNTPETVTVLAGHTTLVTMENIYARLDAAYGWYTVEHYFQDERGVYPEAPNAEERIQVLRAETTTTNAQAKTHPLFTLDTEKHPNGVIEQKYIETNGSTVVKIYYARLKYPYLVRYLEQGTNKVLLTEALRDSQLYRATVTETAPDITGYTLRSARQQSCVIAEETDKNNDGAISAGEIENNIITFYYTENQVEFRYRVVGPDGCGTVSKASEMVNVLTGTPGCTAKENQGCKFMGWYLDEACTKPVPGSWVTGTDISPQKDRAAGTLYTAATYYAKFECIVGNLEVSKTVSAAYAADVIPEKDTFGFTVSLTPAVNAFDGSRDYPCTITIGETTVTQTVDPSHSEITFSLKGGQTAVISGLPLGEYLATEAEAAGYTPQESTGASGSITSGGTAAAAFHNQYDRHRGNLTITKTNAADEEQVFVYEVKNGSEIITVTVVGNGSTTIYDLFVGDYTVTQRNDWSWRYQDPAQNATVAAGKTAAAVFGNGVKDNKWLDGNSPLIKNKYLGESAA